MKIAIGCDSVALNLKKILMDYMKELGYEFSDMGTFTPKDKTDYPIIAEKVAIAVANEGYDRGILLCGTGIGMSIAANKVPGVCVALVGDVYSAQRARLSNNAQIIAMGARVVGPELAKIILKTWLELEFVSGSSSPKIKLVNDLDKKYRKINVLEVEES